MQSPIIRRAIPADGPALARMFLASRRTHLPYLPEIHPDEETEGFVTGLTTRLEVWLAEREGVPIGLVAFGEGWLDHLYLAPGETGRGLGLILLEKAKVGSPRRSATLDVPP